MNFIRKLIFILFWKPMERNKPTLEEMRKKNMSNSNEMKHKNQKQIDEFRKRFEELVRNHRVAYTRRGDISVDFDTNVVNTFQLGQGLEQFIDQMLSEKYNEGYYGATSIMKQYVDHIDNRLRLALKLEKLKQHLHTK